MNASVPGRTVAVVQARMGSTRLPGKVLLRTCGKPLLQHQIERVRRCTTIDLLVLATGTNAVDDPVAELGRQLGVAVYRGSPDDVLDRMVQAARPHRPQYLVRLTGDCPLSDPAVIDQVVRAAQAPGVDYASNALHPTWPDGLDVECMRFAALEEAWREARKPSEREHVTPFLHTQPQRYRLADVRHDPDLSALRWTVDEPADFVFVSQVFEHLYPVNPDFGTSDVQALLARLPSLGTLNATHGRNEGYLRSLAQDALQPAAP
ncbi:glycosyltransferase family protein [Ramlibacter sp.]|uniref:glycosyltransferase family protein n=1 Tax=Ramlibacter sp. TaxID=1917967 RepID=UPI002D34B915|nr:glycosyltransferase family protein [Ramlibacter sp.]HYD74801.1 glycosyltransferase family protein [Ramlibacter sp.]